jgi:hypothetical protein
MEVTVGKSKVEATRPNLRKLGTKSRPQEHESAERPRAGGKLAGHSETQNPSETREVEPSGTGRKMQHLTRGDLCGAERQAERSGEVSRGHSSEEAE